MNTPNIQIRFDHRNVADSESLTQYAYPKLEHVCQHGRVHDVTMVCSVENGLHKISVNLHMPQRFNENIEVSSRDMYATVDEIIPKIERVIKERTDIIGSPGHMSATRPHDVFGESEEDI